MREGARGRRSYFELWLKSIAVLYKSGRSSSAPYDSLNEWYLSMNKHSRQVIWLAVFLSHLLYGECAGFHGLQRLRICLVHCVITALDGFALQYDKFVGVVLPQFAFARLKIAVF